MLKDILERQQRSGYAGFRGASIKVRLPIRETLLNDVSLLEEVRRATNGKLTVNSFSIRDNNLVVVNATVKLPVFSPTVNLEWSIDPIIDVPRDPHLRVRLSRAGMLGFVIEIFSSAVRWPAYVTFANQTISINLQEAIASQARPDLAPLLQYVGIVTQSGQINIDFRLAVP
jgi:hypothetical protein